MMHLLEFAIDIPNSSFLFYRPTDEISILEAYAQEWATGNLSFPQTNFLYMLTNQLQQHSLVILLS